MDILTDRASLGIFVYIFFLLSLIWQSFFLYYTSCLRLLQENFFVKFLKSAAFYSCHPYSVDGLSNSWKYHVWSFLICEKRREKNSVLWTFYGRFCACTILSMKVSKCAKFEEGTWVKTAMSEMWCLLYYVYLN